MGSTGSRSCSIASAGYWPIPVRSPGTFTLPNLIQIEQPASEYQVVAGVGTDAYSAIFPFAFLTRFVMILVNNDAPAAVQLSHDLITVEGERVYEQTQLEIAAARGFRIRNARAGEPVDFQLVAMR